MPLPSWLSFFFGQRAPGPSAAAEASPYGGLSAYPTAEVRPERDQIRADPYPAPYVGPLDLDQYGREDETMRRLYREFHRREPAVRSALEGMAASIADSEPVVVPDDEDDPDDCRVAEFVRWTVDRSSHGWGGLVRNTLLPGLLDGWSVGEPKFAGTAHSRKWSGLWGLEHVKSKDTANLRLRLDSHRNVLGVLNTVRGMETHPLEKTILFTHADVFDNPFGASEMRAAHRACLLIDASYKLWAFALKAYSGPYLVGKVKDEVRRQGMQNALAYARANGSIVLPSADEVDVLSLTNAVDFNAFERKIDKLREEIYMTIRGAYLPFMQGTGGGGDVRGNSGTSKGAGADPRERVLCRAVGRCLTKQLVPWLVYPNFGTKVGLPKIVFGGTDWAETQAQLGVAKTLFTDFKLPLSKKHLYRVAQTPPPASDEDAVIPPADGPGLGGDPFGGDPLGKPDPSTPPGGKPAKADPAASDAPFTGVRKDSLGRERHYIGGRQVAAFVSEGSEGEQETFAAEPKHQPAGSAKGGQFAPKGGGGGGSGAAKKAAETPSAGKKAGPPANNKGGGAGGPDPDAGRPSRPANRHPGNKPPAKPFVAPPPKVPKKEGERFVRPRGDDSQTKRGDEAEAAALQLGFRNILPPGKRSHAPGEVAALGSSIDLEYDHSGRAYELKMCQTTSTEYRLKAKSAEKDAKLRYAKRNKLQPYVMVGVRDVGSGAIHFYAAKEPGMTGAEVSPDKYDYVGTVGGSKPKGK